MCESRVPKSSKSSWGGGGIVVYILSLYLHSWGTMIQFHMCKFKKMIAAKNKWGRPPNP